MVAVAAECTLTSDMWRRDTAYTIPNAAPPEYGPSRAPPRASRVGRGMRPSWRPPRQIAGFEEVPGLGHGLRGELDPRPLPGAGQRVVRIHRRAGLRFIEILADHHALEEDGVLSAGLAHLAQWDRAGQRQRQKPVWLGCEIGVDALERHALFEKDNGGALDERAQRVTHQLVSDMILSQ